jgi:hypothetical protein
MDLTTILHKAAHGGSIERLMSHSPDWVAGNLHAGYAGLAPPVWDYRRGEICPGTRQHKPRRTSAHS